MSNNNYLQRASDALSYVIETIKNKETGYRVRAIINGAFHNLKMDLDGRPTKQDIEKLRTPYYESEAALKLDRPSPSVGDKAWVGVPFPGFVWVCKTKGVWTNTGVAPTAEEVNMAEYVKVQDLPTDYYLVNVEKKQGFYTADGKLNEYVNPDYRAAEFTVAPGEKVFITGATFGLSTQLALYKDAQGNVIGRVKPGTGSKEVFTEHLLTMPDDTITVNVTSYIKEGEPFDIYKKNLSQLAKQSEVDKINDVLFYWEEKILSVKQGFYRPDGTFSAYTNNDFRGAEFAVQETDNIKISGAITGSSTQLILYKDATGSVIGFEQKGTSNLQEFEDYELSKPLGTTLVCLSWSIRDGRSLTCWELVTLKDKIMESSQDWQNQELLAKQGYYRADGTFNAYTTNDFRGAELELEKGHKVKVSAAIAGNVTQLALYKDADGNVLGREITPGSSDLIKVENYELTIPNLTARICFTWALRDGNTMHCAIYMSQQNADILKLDARVKVIENTNTQLKGKDIWYGGTSIPEAGYPAIIAKLLGANIVNKALGGSKCRIGRKIPFEGQNPIDKFGLQGMGDNGARRSLSRTLEEVEYVINNWDVLKPLIPSNTEMTDWAKADMRGASFENSLLPYLNFDLFVFDHGYNDEIGLAIESTEEFLTMPEDIYDRNTYMGAVNFLIKTILEHNPRAKFCFVGHYTDDNPWVQKNAVCKAQEILADYWSAPILKLWEHTRWSQRTVKTTGYWADKYTWVETGGTTRNLTLTQIWMEDNLHPYSVPAQEHLAGIIANWLATVN